MRTHIRRRRSSWHHASRARWHVASAALVHELGDIPALVVEMIVPRRRRTMRAHTRLHVRTRLRPDEVMQVDGLAVNTVARTVLELLPPAATADTSEE